MTGIGKAIVSIMLMSMMNSVNFKTVKDGGDSRKKDRVVFKKYSEIW